MDFAMDTSGKPKKDGKKTIFYMCVYGVEIYFVSSVAKVNQPPVVKMAIACFCIYSKGQMDST